MTTPTYDSPDWRVLSQNEPHVNVSGGTLTAAKTHGPFYVGDLPHIHFLYGTIANRGQVGFACYSDSGTTILVGQDRLVCAAAGLVNAVIPITGPYLVITAESNAYNDTYSLITHSRAVPRSVLSTSLNEPPNLITRAGVAVNAGATVDSDAVYTIPGLAHLSVYSALAAYLVVIQAPTMGGVFRRIATFDQATNPGPMLLYLPPMPVRVSFTNATGAAGTFDVSLICRSILGA